MSDVSKSELAEVIAGLLANNEPQEIINTPWFKEVLRQYRQKQEDGDNG